MTHRAPLWAGLACLVAGCATSVGGYSSGDVKRAEAAMDAKREIVEARAPADCPETDAPPRRFSTLDLRAFRPVPAIPDWAYRSGGCWVSFDVNAQGRTVNIDPFDCTDSAFAIPSYLAVADWRFLCTDAPICNIKGGSEWRIRDGRGRLFPPIGSTETLLTTPYTD